MSEKATPRFGGIPFRAIADDDLTLLDLRMLAVIAAHDGFDKNRRGCFASHKRLAALCGAHYKSAARTIARLVERNYLDAQQQGEDGRLRVYRVIYTEEDHASFRGDGRTHAPARPLRSVTPTVTDKDERSVTSEVTDTPAKGEEDLRGVGNCHAGRSVTGGDEIGNRNASPNEPIALKSNDEGSRIYSTESNRIKDRIDLAEARLSEGAQVARLSPPVATPEIAAAVMQVVHRAAAGRRTHLVGPVTDGDAEIDLAIERQQSGAKPVDLDAARRSRIEAKPSRALLDNALCRAARGLE